MKANSGRAILSTASRIRAIRAILDQNRMPNIVTLSVLAVTNLRKNRQRFLETEFSWC